MMVSRWLMDDGGCGINSWHEESDQRAKRSIGSLEWDPVVGMVGKAFSTRAGHRRCTTSSGSIGRMLDREDLDRHGTGYEILGLQPVLFDETSCCQLPLQLSKEVGLPAELHGTVGPWPVLQGLNPRVWVRGLQIQCGSVRGTNNSSLWLKFTWPTISFTLATISFTWQAFFNWQLNILYLNSMFYFTFGK